MFVNCCNPLNQYQYSHRGQLRPLSARFAAELGIPSFTAQFRVCTKCRFYLGKKFPAGKRRRHRICAPDPILTGINRKVKIILPEESIRVSQNMENVHLKIFFSRLYVQ